MTPENNPFFNKKHSDETKKHLSDVRKGKRPNNGFISHSEQTKKKMSKVRKELYKNNNFRKKMSLANQLRISIICNETNEFFNSIKDAAKSENIKYATFKKKFKKGELINGKTYRKSNF